MNRICEIEDELPLSDDEKTSSGDEVSPTNIGKLFSDINVVIFYAVLDFSSFRWTKPQEFQTTGGKPQIELY